MVRPVLRYSCVLLAASAAFGRSLDGVPLSFEPNQGQLASTAPFLARGEGYWLEFEPSQVTIHLASGKASPEVIRMRFRNASAATIETIDRMAHKANYLRGDSANWRTGVDQYERLRYRGVYPGIDLVFYGQQRQFEYDFVVAPGADPAAIEIEFEGARPLIGPAGDLNLETSAGRLVHHSPVVYQEHAGRRASIAARYRATNTHRVGFEIGAHDPSRPLVIDPVMQYSSFVGGKAPNGADDMAFATALDADGNIYLAGRTASSDFPLQSALQGQNKGSGDAFVMKLDPTGKKLIYSTFIGGGSLEYAYALAVDSQGQAHITGQTGSADFPVKNAFQSKKTGLNNLFVTKLNAAGNAIVFSTLMGGERNDAGRGIAIDSFGNVFVAGFTNSAQFPTKNAMQPKHSGLGADGLLAKFSPSGDLMFSTFVGKQNEIYALAVDNAGAAYMTGTVTAAGLATPNAARTRVFPRDAFVAKVVSDGSAFGYFTYLGGNGTDEGHAITVDGQGNAYVAGFAGSRDFPTTGGVVQEKIAGNSDAFITKINELGTEIVWSTYLGGTALTPAVDDESVKGIAVDADGFIYVTGSTLSADFPMNRATQAAHRGRRDVFLTKLTPDASQIIFSTFVGGADHDDANGLAVSPLRAMFVTGQTFSANFPTEKALLDARGSTSDGFLTRVCDPVMFLSGDSFDFTWTQGTDAPAVQAFLVRACRDLVLDVAVDADWLSAAARDPKDGTTEVGLTVKPQALEPGDYTATVTVSNPDVFFGPKQVRVALHVLPPPPPPEMQ
ncbi:MAG: SBBP repeat-containing protein [Bryobacteraceae bacterium]